MKEILEAAVVHANVSEGDRVAARRGYEPPMYTRGGSFSFFDDLARATTGDGAAGARLEIHIAECSRA